MLLCGLQQSNEITPQQTAGSQHPFHCADTALVKVTKDLLLTSDAREILVLLDLNAAFDTELIIKSFSTTVSIGPASQVSQFVILYILILQTYNLWCPTGLHFRPYILFNIHAPTWSNSSINTMYLSTVMQMIYNYTSH